MRILKLFSITSSVKRKFLKLNHPRVMQSVNDKLDNFRFINYNRI